MSAPHRFRCNLPPSRSLRPGSGTQLATFGPAANVQVKLADIAKVLVGDLTGRLADLVELASFVYAADGAVSREGWVPGGAEERWRRSFRLDVGVRDPDFWKSGGTRGLLERLLGFLSDDDWELRFSNLAAPPPVQAYLQFGSDAPQEWPFRRPERVIMFSGGLDSLAGAVETAERGGPLLLVSHRSTATMESRQSELLNRLVAAYPEVRVRRVGVWVNKLGTVASADFAQRTRSFLYWALGVAVGQSVEAGGVRFFENGVISLNLPLADQVQGARASRTTHPRSLGLMEELAGQVTGRPFKVDNPYLFQTKADVVRKLVAAREPDLIRSTCSCTRTRIPRRQAWHCGCCSQCIDRRLACLAAGAAELDPPMDYRVDVMDGARESPADRQMATFYARRVIELERMTPDDIGERFAAELARASLPFPDPQDVAERLAALHVRHGRDAFGAMNDWLRANSSRILGGDIDPHSLAGLVIGGEHLRSPWEHLARRLCTVLDKGLPRLCQSEQPANEPRLQEMCDSLFASHGETLDREFPFMRWGGRATKPDWSKEEARLWVELKYVRHRKDILGITEAIAADITKYRSGGHRCLFVTYDPSGHLVDREAFLRDIEKHEGVMAHVVS